MVKLTKQLALSPCPHCNVAHPLLSLHWEPIDCVGDRPSPLGQHDWGLALMRRLAPRYNLRLVVALQVYRLYFESTEGSIFVVNLDVYAALAA